MDSRLGEGTSRCQTVCPWAVRWADALGAVPGRPWDGIWHTGDVIGHTRDVLGRPMDGRIVPRTSTGQWTHYGRSTPHNLINTYPCNFPVSVVSTNNVALYNWPISPPPPNLGISFTSSCMRAVTFNNSVIIAVFKHTPFVFDLSALSKADMMNQSQWRQYLNHTKSIKITEYESLCIIIT